MFYLIVGTPLLCVAPWFIVRFILKTTATANLPYTAHVGYLYAAAVVWALALILPPVPISPETDTYLMHSLGGVVAAILFEYVCKVYRLSFGTWWQRVVAVYFFVSGLGVANELLEFFMAKTGLMNINGNDTWWDLVANTTGSLAAFMLFRIFTRNSIKQ